MGGSQSRPLLREIAPGVINISVRGRIKQENPLYQDLIFRPVLNRTCGAQIPIRRFYSIDKSPARRSCWNDGGGGAQVLRLLVLAIAAIFRPKALLIAENLCLRQQLVVLQRRHPRPRLSDADRRFWILASRWFGDWGIVADCETGNSSALAASGLEGVLEVAILS
jgi:hypothetical protein